MPEYLVKRLTFMTNKITESTLRAHIERRSNWKLIDQPRSNGENGVDAVASFESTLFLIEVIGYKRTGSARSKDFFEVFWRAISRLDMSVDSQCTTHNANDVKLVIALPSEFLRGINQRTRHYTAAWRRIADAFPELEVWFVDEAGFNRYSWLQVLQLEGSF